jgi:hypothetical protein
MIWLFYVVIVWRLVKIEQNRKILDGLGLFVWSGIWMCVHGVYKLWVCKVAGSVCSMLCICVSTVVQVTKEDKSFQNIMKCYRSQPQASSSVSTVSRALCNDVQCIWKVFRHVCVYIYVPVKRLDTPTHSSPPTNNGAGGNGCLTNCAIF